MVLSVQLYYLRLKYSTITAGQKNNAKKMYNNVRVVTRMGYFELNY